MYRVDKGTDAVAVAGFTGLVPRHGATRSDPRISGSRSETEHITTLVFFYDSTMAVKALTTVNEDMVTAPLPTRLRCGAYVMVRDCCIGERRIYFLMAGELPTAGSSSAIVLLWLAALYVLRIIFSFGA
jgi:hypothetical protein